MDLNYPAQLQQDDDGRYVVTFPDMPYGATDGTTQTEALLEAVDCLDEVLAGLMEDGLPLPHPSAKKHNQHLIHPSAQISAKAALYTAMIDAGITKVELATRLECDEKEVRRMLDPRHPTKLPRIEQALVALGKRLVVSVEDAA